MSGIAAPALSIVVPVYNGAGTVGGYVGLLQGMQQNYISKYLILLNFILR